MSYQAITLNDEDADMSNRELANDLAKTLLAMFHAKFPNQLALVTKGCFGTVYVDTFLTDAAHINKHGNGIPQNDQFRHFFIVNVENGEFSLDFSAPCLTVNPINEHLYCSHVKLKNLRKPCGDEKTIREWFAKFLVKRAAFIALHRDNIKNVNVIDEKYFVIGE